MCQPLSVTSQQWQPHCLTEEQKSSFKKNPGAQLKHRGGSRQPRSEDAQASQRVQASPQGPPAGLLGSTSVGCAIQAYMKHVPYLQRIGEGS